MAKKTTNKKGNFHHRLLLNKYLLHQFGVLSFQPLAEDMRWSIQEGYTQEGNTKYLDLLKQKMYNNDLLTAEMLQEYDDNIVRHTRAVSEKREGMVVWKYFQYFSLLFTEMYLDAWFRGPEKLLESVNRFVDEFNDPFSENYKLLNPDSVTFSHFTKEELSKIAFWNATGSGKTLLMHINIKQFLHYSKKYQKHDFNKVLLITPNEGLSHQHLQEFHESGMDAEIFSKQTTSGFFSGKTVEILEISKLSETSGDKTVAVDSFETNNLVLIDEGHRGSGGDVWKKFRDRLSEDGFAFEYSATFGQAINAINSSGDRNRLEQEYGKSILFDYSYKFFYKDGYGKDYRILNLRNEDEQYLRKYFAAAVLSYYQQLLIFDEKSKQLRNFLLEKPLWVFVGGTVTQSVGKQEASDIAQIMLLINGFVKSQAETIASIQSILQGNDGLTSASGASVFTGKFGYLKESGKTAEEIYSDILKKVFQSSAADQTLYVDYLKGADGELGLRMGISGEYFGVINVGDAKKLSDILRTQQIPGDDRDFSSSLFRNINEENSNINLLIGSKKFTEGWSSWRVSCMGLMNVGKSDGAQIIQLFGRGVRLKGLDFCLKRSNSLDEYQKPADLGKIRKFLQPLETLNVFGVHADYMEKFREFLEQEGLPPNDASMVTVEVKTVIKKEMMDLKLKTVTRDETEDFREYEKIKLVKDFTVVSEPVELDWYPKIQMLMDKNAQKEAASAKQSGILSEQHLKYINWSEIYFELQQYKSEKHFSNLEISLENLQDIMLSNQWYRLWIPSSELAFDRYGKVLTYQQIAGTLLKKYMERFYLVMKGRFYSDKFRVSDLDYGDDNLIDQYLVHINQELDDEGFETAVSAIAQNVKTLKQEKIKEHFQFFDAEQHIYKPLVYLDTNMYKDIIYVNPVPLDLSETDFVRDVESWCRKHKSHLGEKKVVLLRNQSKKGYGYFVDNGNFYPDFILWIVDGGKQYISFFDPKGLKNANGMTDRKIQMFRHLKNVIQPKLSPDIILNSFIISNTRWMQINWKGDASVEDFEANNVYFQYDTATGNYMDKVISKILKQI